MHKIKLSNFLLFFIFISNINHVFADQNPIVKRVNFIVSDLDQSLKIYRDVLGMEIFEIKNSDTDSYSYPVFNLPEEALIRFASLNMGKEKRAFALTEVKNTPLPVNKGIRMSTVVISISDLEDKYNQIGLMGLFRTDIDSDHTPEGHSFSEFSFLDFDGHLIVLYEIKD